MDPLLVVAAVLLVVLLAIMLPVWREQYEEQYDDQEEFFRARRSRLWELVGGMQDRSEDDAHDTHPPGWCPACRTENERSYTYCRNCNRRLPSQDG